MKATMTLTAQDLHAIRGIVTDTVEETVPPIVDLAVGKAIDELSLQVGAGFNEITERFEGVKADIAEFKTDVSELKTDMHEVKWHLTDTVRRGEFTDLRQYLDRIRRGPN